MPPSPPPLSLLHLINEAVSLLLLSTLTPNSFHLRFHILRSKLFSLQSSLLSLPNDSISSDSSSLPHWSHNSLLEILLTNLHSTLRRLCSLADRCCSSSNDTAAAAPEFSGGKLLMQSDLDMATAALSDHLRDLDLILRSGVLRLSSAIVLSQPSTGADEDELAFFVRDLFTRLQIGGIEFKEEAMDSLMKLLSNDDNSVAAAAIVVAREGNVPYLIQLLDYGGTGPLREQAVAVVAILATASEGSREAVFEEGGMGPLLRILDTGTLALKEKASTAIEALTSDPENAWAVSAYGGVTILVEACRNGSPQTQAYAVGAVRNVLVVEDMRNSFVEENVIPVLIELLICGVDSVEEKSAECLSILASSGDQFRSLILYEKGLQRLLQSVHDSSNLRTMEHSLSAIHALSCSDPISKALSSSTCFLIQLADLIVQGSVSIQKIAASLISNLSISDGNKRAMASCMPQLVKLMEMPKPGGIQEAASQALVSLLSVKSNRKFLSRDEKSVMRLVQAMDVRNEAVCKQYPVAVVTALACGDRCRKRLVAAGALAAAQRLAEIEVVGARKAVMRLTGNRFRNIFSRSWRE